MQTRGYKYNEIKIKNTSIKIKLKTYEAVDLLEPYFISDIKKSGEISILDLLLQMFLNK